MNVDNDGDLDIFPQLGYLQIILEEGELLLVGHWINNITKIYYLKIQIQT